MDFYLGTAPYPTPSFCVYCHGSQNLLVSPVEIPGFGYVLSCETCDRAKARIRGFAKGKRMEQLVNADTRLSEMEKELAERDATIQRQIEQAADHKRQVAQLQDIIEGYRGRERQQEHLAGILAETAKQMTEVRSLTPAA